MPERPVRSVLGRCRLGPVLVAAGPDATVRDAARRMAETCRGNLLVVEDGRVLGLFTERDLLDRVVAAGRDPAGTRLREVMTTEPATIGADAPVREAILRTQVHGIDVDDAANHRINIYEIHRRFPNDKPNCEGLKRTDEWVRGFGDFTDL